MISGKSYGVIDMEFGKKLQELRKQKGLTQEELAGALYVSRTAISKWESGRGYPNIDSLKAIAAFFSVTVDELLSSNEVLTIATEDKRQTKTHLCDLVCGMLDLCMLLLLFLPLFAGKTAEDAVHPASLISLGGVQTYLRVLYFAAVIGMAVWGILTLALQNCGTQIWVKSKTTVSLALGTLAVLLFILSRQPYAAVFALTLGAIKAFVRFRYLPNKA